MVGVKRTKLVGECGRWDQLLARFLFRHLSRISISTYVKKTKQKLFSVIYERFRFQKERKSLIKRADSAVGQSATIIKIPELNNDLESD